MATKKLFQLFSCFFSSIGAARSPAALLLLFSNYTDSVIKSSVGIGKATVIDSIEIKWPCTKKVQGFTDQYK